MNNLSIKKLFDEIYHPVAGYHENSEYKFI